MFSYFLSGNIGLKLDLATPTARTPLYSIRGLSSWQLQKVLPSPICLFGWTLSDFWEICKDYFLLFFYKLVVLSKTETWSNRDFTQSVFTEPTFSVQNMHVKDRKEGLISGRFEHGTFWIKMHVFCFRFESYLLHNARHTFFGPTENTHVLDWKHR